jgi:hypothetical protein
MLTLPIALIPPDCSILHHMLDTELFLQSQLVPHRENLCLRYYMHDAQLFLRPQCVPHREARCGSPSHIKSLTYGKIMHVQQFRVRLKLMIVKHYGILSCAFSIVLNLFTQKPQHFLRSSVSIFRWKVYKEVPSLLRSPR